jgi:hypothetical protein
MKIGYSLAEHTRKFVFIGIEPCLFPCHPFPCPLFPSLVYVLCLLSVCLSVSVLCLTSLFLVFRPLFPVSHLCPLSPILSSLSHFSVPCFPPFVYNPLLHVSLLCSLSPVLCSMSHFSVPCPPSSVPCIPSSVPCLFSLFLVFPCLPSSVAKKIWFRVCSVTAKMFDHRNSGEN